VTTRFYLDLTYRCTVTGPDPQRHLEEHLDCVADELMGLDGIVDPDLGATLSTGVVTFTLGVDAETMEAAMRLASAAIRTAIHAADGCTPNWAATYEDIESTVRSAEPDLV
jgi:hypothetical protein